MTKKYISDQNLEEYIVNFLRKKAEYKSLNIEDFSKRAIINEIKEKYDVDDDKIKKILNKLEKNDIISVKSRYLNIYVPKGYENKFRDLVQKIDPINFFAMALIIGCSICFFGISLISNYLGREIVTRFGNLNNPNDFLIYLYSGLIIPSLLGAVILFLSEKIWNFLYRNIRIFRELIEFFGGVRVWCYALFFAFVFLILYISLSIIFQDKINPYYSTSIFILVFMGILYFGGKKK